MEKVKELLAQLAEALALNQRLLARARRRYRANRSRAFVAHNQQKRAEAQADKCRRERRPKAAERAEKEAARRSHVAYRNHLRAQFWLGRIKVLLQRVEELESRSGDYEQKLKDLDTVTIKGNHATGGSRRERLKALALKSAAECSSGHRRNFYSQAGSWDVDHCITGESYGERSDCSSWFTSVYKAAGLADPNGLRYTGGYTGTLIEHGKQVNTPKPGDAVIYGSGTGHHVEMYVGPGDRTIGHGSSPVDAGVIDLFGDGDYRFYSYL